MPVLAPPICMGQAPHAEQGAHDQQGHALRPRSECCSELKGKHPDRVWDSDQISAYGIPIRFDCRRCSIELLMLSLAPHRPRFAHPPAAGLAQAPLPCRRARRVTTRSSRAKDASHAAWTPRGRLRLLLSVVTSDRWRARDASHADWTPRGGGAVHHAPSNPPNPPRSARCARGAVPRRANQRGGPHPPPASTRGPAADLTA